MDCVLCGNDAKFRKVKGEPVCRECTEKAKAVRERLNMTRTNPKHNFNQLGQPPITLREIVLTAKAKRESGEVVDESVRTSETT